MRNCGVWCIWHISLIALFQSGAGGVGGGGVIFFADIEVEDLEAVINYIYTGEVSVREENLARFIRMCQKLKVKGLSSSAGTAADPSNQVSLPHSNDTRIHNFS